MKKCPNCGTKNSDSAKHCNFCNTHFPEAEQTIKKETNYVHNSEAEKRKAKNRKIIVFVVIALVISVLSVLLSVVFSSDKTTPNEEMAGMLIDAFTPSDDGTAKKISGTISGKNYNQAFEVEIFKDKTVLNLGEDAVLTFSDNGLLIKNGTSESYATADSNEYKLYIAYLTLNNISSSNKNVLKYETEDIKNVFLPVVKNNLLKNFNETFIEENFISAISSVLMTFESTPELKTYFGITLPDDVNNAEISFDVSSYSFQNHTLSQFKKTYINSADYEAVNQILKDAKNDVKNSYGAKGSFKTENGKLVSASADIMYNGYAYNLSLNFQ